MSESTTFTKEWKKLFWKLIKYKCVSWTRNVIQGGTPLIISRENFKCRPMSLLSVFFRIC